MGFYRTARTRPRAGGDGARDAHSLFGGSVGRLNRTALLHAYEPPEERGPATEWPLQLVAHDLRLGGVLRIGHLHAHEAQLDAGESRAMQHVGVDTGL